MAKDQMLEDNFLGNLQENCVPVSVFLVNGIKLQGQIESFDDHIIVLKNSISQVIFKHAISTIVPISKGTGSYVSCKKEPVAD